MPRRVIALDAGGTKLLAGVLDDELRGDWRLRASWGDADVLEVFAWAVAEARGTVASAEAVGVGIPSRIAWPAGISVGAAHLPLEGVPFRDVLAEQTGLPVFVDNDANLAALAESRAGAAKGASDALMITIGTGIGGGLVLGGRVYRGTSGAAGEIGHMTIDFDGPPCGGDCPGRGCFETYVSGPALARAGMEAAARHPGSALAAAVAGDDPPPGFAPATPPPGSLPSIEDDIPIDGLRVTQLALEGDAAAIEAVTEVGHRLGAGIAGLLNLFDPEVVVIGGGVAGAGELLLGPARDAARQRALSPAAARTRIERAHFGEEAGLVGAAVLALAGGDA